MGTHDKSDKAGSRKAADHTPDQSETERKIAASVQSPSIESPRIVPAQLEPAAPLNADLPASETSAEAIPAFASFAGRLRAFGLASSAATIALAVGVGALAGSIGTLGVAHVLSAPASETSAANDARALKDAILRLDSDLAGLKSGLENSAKAASMQFSRIAERLDRTERAQAEPAAKLAKLAEALDRFDRRASATAAAADVAGSIPEPRPSPLAASKDASRPPVVTDWVLRNVRDGAALIQGRVGLVEVAPGDLLPGGGRVEAIRRQDGHWVVVTSKGLIVTR